MSYTAPPQLEFKLISGFARYILECRLDEYVRNQLTLSRTLKMPILKYFEHMGDDELLEYSKKTNKEFFQALANNNVQKDIDASLESWKNNQLNFVRNAQIELDDLLLASYARKTNLSNLARSYTDNPDMLLELIAELDRFFIEYDRSTTNMYINLLVKRERDIKRQLTLREEDLLEAQELSNMGSYIWNLNGGPSFTTPQTNKILGINDKGELDEFMKNVHQADKEMVRTALDKAIHGNGEFEAEYRYRVKEHEKVIWSKGKVTFENGRAVSMKGTVMDVTDKHHMVQKLKRSELLYKQAEYLNKLGNWTWEIRSGIMEWSDELYRIFGIEASGEKQTYDRFMRYIHPDDKQERADDFQRQMQHTNLMDYHFRIIDEEGHQKILHGQSHVLFDDDGHAFKMIGTCQDVTKQKELENKLYQKTIQLERSNASLEDFAFISSHDLKEPLRKISVFGDKLMQIQKDLHPEARQAVDKMVHAARKMQQMVDELLALSRISSDHSFRNCNLNNILKDAIRSMDDQIKESRAIIDAGKLPEAYVNEVQFHQLFQNLLSNAIKFRKSNTAPKIKISAKHLSRDEILFHKLDPAKKYFRIEFSDNGIGFSEGYSDKIFTIFQRLHGQLYEGTGIGLALCKKIIEHHNGVIFATSEEGNGSIFTMIIPES